MLYYPSFITQGVAIHGSLSVPIRPASHGCIRIPMFASQRLTMMVPKGTPVIVYGCVEEAPTPASLAVEALRAGGG